MVTRESSGLTCEPADCRSPLESEVVEVSLLLSGATLPSLKRPPTAKV